MEERAGTNLFYSSIFPVFKCSDSLLMLETVDSAMANGLCTG